jgi:hypothetical protein
VSLLLQGRWGWACAAAYALLVAAMVFGLFTLRRSTIAQWSTPQAQADWEAWRAAAQEQSGSAGPVQRRQPRSPEPPTLVLMRDHFGVVVTAAVVFFSVLFWFAVILIGGMAGGSRRPGM